MPPKQPTLLRRSLLLAGLGHIAGVQALTPRQLVFPRDFGAHPDLRTEWWYITGHASVGDRLFGFQLTFFRSRVDATQGMVSRLAARQLIFAHAAVTDVQNKKLWHDQRIARASGDARFDQAHASERDTDIALRDWTLQRQASPAGDVYSAQILASDFQLALQFTARQPLLLQGSQGLSRKGPAQEQASYYYSQPQLAVRGRITLKGQHHTLDTNTQAAAWLDHEWSEALLHPQAVGWDWIGINLFDGSALTAFHLRDHGGNTLWDGGSFRSGTNAGQTPARIFQRGEVSFTPLRRWQSPASQASYPVEWTVQTPSGHFTVKAIIDNQELDSRASTGAIYWEGLSDLFDSQGRHVGRGYLEMTGYAGTLRM
ncbi:MAG: carotenoid 1,2-hydratase [Curvibacter sp. PD_MW3]|nr:MAG: carotenoid 1,2-hydratase [Curvibacter sp. PD_MW3]